ncbi:MAG: LCP family protein [Aristaeellaceae bacterium]
MNRRQKRHRQRLCLLLVLAAGAVLLLGLTSFGLWLEKQLEQPEASGDPTLRYAYSGLMASGDAAYRLRSQITTVLLLGIDQEAGSADSGYRSGGQADFIRLLVLDAGEKTLSQLQLDRDTMATIPVLGVLGDRVGTRRAQLCLSHGFGNGREQSCELTAEAVSGLLGGIPIDFYIAMSLDGISVLNDLLGGVTVTLAEDFSALDPAMTPGTTLTLTGDQAEIYVRARWRIGVGTNEARMARQEQYIAGIMDNLGARLSGNQAENQAFIGKLYDALSPYLTTNLSRGRLMNMALAARDYEHTPIRKPEGCHVVGTNGYMEFHADESALKQMVTELFYQKLP